MGDGVASGGSYEGYIGGAPLAEIVPAKIGGVLGSVVHLSSESLARGLAHMLGPGDGKRCDVVSLSHGGLPAASWATVVNQLYDAGVVLVAAAGDSFQEELCAFPTHQTCYPAAFDRAITATGLTFTTGPYTTTRFGEMQGCWGPAATLQKSIAAAAANVSWMLAGTVTGWDNDGAGTSASTPQIAAAFCALWLAEHGYRFPTDWQRVAACREALFASAAPTAMSDQTGRSRLDVEAMLAPDLAIRLTALAQTHKLPYLPPDTVSFPLLRLLFDLPPPGTAAAEMCETEALQLVFTSSDAHLRDLVRNSFNSAAVSPGNAAYLRSAFTANPDMSSNLRAYLAKPSP